ncbi:MAG: hypothetical protein AAGA57_10855 [Planctomycetota bacterium]
MPGNNSPDLAQISALFGDDWFTRDLFGDGSGRLKFQLRVGEHPLDEVLSAWRRASKLVKQTLEDASDVCLTTTLHTESSVVAEERVRHLNSALGQYGLPTTGTPAQPVAVSQATIPAPTMRP